MQIFSKHLRARGLRLTPERARILRGVLSMPSHFEPDDLLDHIRRSSGAVSRASVYRTLPLLVECGLIEEAIYKDRRTRYERSIGREHHDHLLCTSCGAIIEFVSEPIERLQDDVCREHGFQATSHTLEIRGRCRDCGERADTD